MGTQNTSRGYRYPDGDATPAMDIWNGDLAEDINADMTTQVARITAAENGITTINNKIADTGSLPDGGTPDPIASFAAGWSQYTGAPWAAGIRVRRWGPLVIASGALTKSSAWVANETAFTLATGFRPDQQLDNGRYTVATDGTVKVIAAGSGAVPLYLVFFRA